MNSSFKHREIYEALVMEIANGTYDSTGRLPSEAQLVRRFSVSRPTAARALRDLQTEGRVVRQAGAGSFLVKDKTHAPAQITRRRLGLLIPNMGVSEIFDAVCGELASLARVEDYSLMWADGRMEREARDITVKDVEKVCTHLIDSGVGGVFFAPFEFSTDKDQVSKRAVDLLRRAGVSIVLLDRDMLPFPQRSDYDLVGIDNVAAGYLAAEHLLKLGVRRLGFVARPESAPTISARIAGVREALVTFGVEVPRKLAHFGDPMQRDFARRLVAGGQVEGIVCANDLTAAQLMKTLATFKVRVPQDVRLVGFDNLRYADLLAVPLTTISQPARAIATHAMRTMIDRMRHASLPAASIMIMPQLIVRASCGAFLAPNKAATTGTT